MRGSSAIAVALALAAALAVEAEAPAFAQDEPNEFAKRPERPGRKFPVLIGTEPEGATVYLDGREYGPLGKTPLRTRLAAGDYRLILELDGHESLETTMRVRRRRGRQRFVEELVPKLLGMISVRAPRGVAGDVVVNVDGEPVGYAPLDYEIELGPHQVLVEHEGGGVFEEWVEVTIDEPVVVEPEFEGADLNAAVEPEPEPEARRDDSRRSRERGEPRTAMLLADAGVEFGGRRFRYSGGTTNNLRPYDAFGVPMLRIGAQFYPLANSRSARLRALGIEGRVAFAPALESRTAAGEQGIDTAWMHVAVGARARYNVGKALLGVVVGYRQESFDFADGNAIEDEVPDVVYQTVYVGADARVPAGPLELLAGVRVLPVLSAGPTAERFASASVFGIGATVGAAYGIGNGFELRAEAAYRGFFYGLNAAEGDQFVADGATDSLLGLTLSAAFSY